MNMYTVYNMHMVYIRIYVRYIYIYNIHHITILNPLHQTDCDFFVTNIHQTLGGPEWCWQESQIRQIRLGVSTFWVVSLLGPKLCQGVQCSCHFLVNLYHLQGLKKWYPKNAGMSWERDHPYILRMGLESKKSYSREVSGFLWISSPPVFLMFKSGTRFTLLL